MKDNIIKLPKDVTNYSELKEIELESFPANLHMTWKDYLEVAKNIITYITGEIWRIFKWTIKMIFLITVGFWLGFLMC